MLEMKFFNLYKKNNILNRDFTWIAKIHTQERVLQKSFSWKICISLYFRNQADKLIKDMLQLRLILFK